MTYKQLIERLTRELESAKRDRDKNYRIALKNYKQLHDQTKLNDLLMRKIMVAPVLIETAVCKVATCAEAQAVAIEVDTALLNYTGED